MRCSPAYVYRTLCAQARRRQAEIEDRLDTWRTIADLPEDLRQIAYLLAEGCNDSEVAEGLGLSHDQVYRRRQRLRKLYRA